MSPERFFVSDDDEALFLHSTLGTSSGFSTSPRGSMLSRDGRKAFELVTEAKLGPRS